MNAIAHRDYESPAAVQVYVFADRAEVWNPGELPPSLTPEQLGQPHPSLPRNPLICEALFLAHYIEKAGTGTLDVIAACRAAGLPAPQFEQRGDQFVVTLWRDWMTDRRIAELGLTDRQRKALVFARSHGRITNIDQRRIAGATKKTASRDLDDLVRKGALVRVGTTGRGTYYVLADRGRGQKGDKGDMARSGAKGDPNGTKGTSRTRRGASSRRKPEGTERKASKGSTRRSSASGRQKRGGER